MIVNFLKENLVLGARQKILHQSVQLHVSLWLITKHESLLHYTVDVNTIFKTFESSW